jgi:hypothetical protein
MAEAWGWEVKPVRTFLKRLEMAGQITTRTGTPQTVITNCNYDRYQTAPDREGTQTGAQWACNGHKEKQSNKVRDDDGKARAGTPTILVSQEALALADEICCIVGHDPEHPPPQWCGAAMHVAKWFREGWQREVILVAVTRAAAKRAPGDRTATSVTAPIMIAKRKSME